MSSTSLLIIDIRNKLLSSIGITFILLGTVGNLLNIILFRKRSLWTLSPSIPFLLFASVANLIDIYSCVTLRMLIGFKITPTFYSSVACKLQLYLYYTSYSLSSWFMVGCCIDRFFSSSRHAIMRSYSNMRMTTRMILFISIIIPLVYSQTLYCYEANQFNQIAPCYPQNNVCNIFDIICYFIFQAIGPPVMMLVFGIGTFTHLRQGRHVQQVSTNNIGGRIRMILSRIANERRRSGREILRMLTMQVTLYFICSMPFFAMKIYSLVPWSTVKSPVQLSVENLILNIAVLCSFVDKIFSFYIYTLCSKYYRRELIKLATQGWSQQRVAPRN